MSGQNDGAASGHRARVKRRGRTGGPRLPDKIGIACPARTRDRIEEAAAFDGLTPAEWLRQAIRLALEASRKRQARAASNGGAR